MPSRTDYYGIVKARVPAQPKAPSTTANCTLPDEVLDSQDNMELKARHNKVADMDVVCVCSAMSGVCLGMREIQLL